MNESPVRLDSGGVVGSKLLEIMAMGAEHRRCTSGVERPEGGKLSRKAWEKARMHGAVPLRRSSSSQAHCPLFPPAGRVSGLSAIRRHGSVVASSSLLGGLV
jgi:hypothetical protein